MGSARRHTALMQYVLLYIMILMHGAVIWAAFVEDSYPGIIAVTLLVLCAIFVYKVKVPLSYYFFCLATFGCYLLSSIINGIGLGIGLNIKTALIVDLNILMVITIYQVDKKQAIRRFIRIILFLSATSLIFYGITLIFGTGLLSKILTPVKYGRGYHGFLLYTFAPDNRNYGIFSEPGVYQILLTAALYCFVYFGDLTGFSKKNQKYAVAILVLTIITSLSTTGYIALLIIICGLILKKRAKLDRQILAFAVFSVVVLLTEYLINGKNSILQTYVINKLSEVSDLQSSGGARMFVIRHTLEAIKIDPFFGIGSKILESSITHKYYVGFGTGNILFSTIATKGFITLFVTLGYIFAIAFRHKSSASQYFIFVCLFFNTIIAQTQIAYSALLLIAIIEPAAEKMIRTHDSVVTMTRSGGELNSKIC